MYTFSMPQEVSLSDQHKASLLLHNLASRRDQKLLNWLDELILAKGSSIDSFRSKIDELQKLIQNVEEDIDSIKKHKQDLVSDSKVKLEIILKKIVTDVGIGPNSKAQLIFDGDEPKLLLHE
jgi:hypothetical protein